MSSSPAPGQVPYLVFMLPLLLLTATIAGAIPAKISTALDEHGLGSLGSSGGSSLDLEQQNFREGRFLRPSRIADGYFNGISVSDKQNVHDYALNTIDDTEREEFENKKESIRAKAVLTKTEYNKLMKKFDYGKIPKKGITYQYKPSSYLDLPRSFIRYDEILASKNTDKFILLDEESASDPGSATESPLVAYPEDTLRDLIVHLLEPNLFLKVPASAWVPGQTPRSSIKFSEVEVLDGDRHPGNAKVLSLSVLDPVLSQIRVLGGQEGRSLFDSPLSPETRISLDEVPIGRLLQESTMTNSQHPSSSQELPNEDTSGNGNLEYESLEDMSSLSDSLDSSGSRNTYPVVNEEYVVSVTQQEANSSDEKTFNRELADSDKEKNVSTSGKIDPYVHYEEQDHVLLNTSKSGDPSVFNNRPSSPSKPDSVRRKFSTQEQNTDNLPMNQPPLSRPKRGLNLFRFSGESGQKYLQGHPYGPLPPPSNYTPTYGIRNATIDPERKRQRFNQLVMNMDVSSDSLLTPFLFPAARSLDSLANLMEYTMPTLPPLIAPSDLPMLFTIPPVEEWFPAINTSASPYNWTLPKAAKLTSLPGLNLTSLPGLDLSSLPGLNLTSLPGLDLSSLPGLNLTSLPGLDLSSLPGLNLTSLPGLDLSSLPGLNLTSLPGLDLSSLPGLNLGSLPGLNLSSLSGLDLTSLPGLNITSLPNLDLTNLRNTDNQTVSGLPNIDNLFSSSLSGKNNNSENVDIFADLRNKFLSLSNPSDPNTSASDRLNHPFMELVDENKTDFLKNMAIKYQSMMNTSSDSQMPSAIENLASIFSTSSQSSTVITPNALDSEQSTSSSGLRNVFGTSDEQSNLFNINPSMLNSIPQNVNLSSLFSLTGAFSPTSALNNNTQESSNIISSLLSGMNPTIKNKLQNFFNSSTPVDASNIFSLISRAAENATSEPENGSDLFNIFTQTADLTTVNPINLSNIFGQDTTPETITLSDILNIFTQSSEITTANPFNLTNIFLQSTQETTTAPNIFGFTSQPTTTTGNPWNLTNIFSVAQETTTPNPWNLFSQSTEANSQNPWNISKLFQGKEEEAAVTTSPGSTNLFSLSTEASTPNPWNLNTIFSQTTEATSQNPWNLFNTFPQSTETAAASNPINLFSEVSSSNPLNAFNVFSNTADVSTQSPLNAFNVFSSPPEVSTRSSLDLFNTFFRPTEPVTPNPWNLFNAFRQPAETTTPNPWNFLNLFGPTTTTPSPGSLFPSNLVGIGGTSNQNLAANNIDDITEFFRRSGMAVNKGSSAVKEANSNPLFIPRSYLPPAESANQDNIISSASFEINPFVTNIRQTSQEETINEPASSSVLDDSNIMSIVSSVLSNPSHLPNVPNYIQGLSMDTILAMVPNLNPNLISSFLPFIKNNMNATTSTSTQIPLLPGVRDTNDNLTVDIENDMGNSSNDEPDSIDTFKQNFLNLFAVNKSASDDHTLTSHFITPPPLFPNLGNNRRSDISSWTPLTGYNANEDDSTFKHNANDPLTIKPAKPVLVFSVNDDEAPRTSKSALTVNFNKVVRNEPGKLIPASGLNLPPFRSLFGRSLEETANTGTNIWTPPQGPLQDIPPEMIQNFMASSGVSNDLLENVFRAMRSADFTDSSSNTYTSNNSLLPTLPPFVFPTFPPIEVTPPTTSPPSLFRYDPTTTTTIPPPFTLFPPLVLPTTSAPGTQNKSADDDFTRFLQEQATKMSEFFEQMSDFSVGAVTHLKDAGTVVDSLGSAASRTIHALVEIAQVLEPVTHLITRKIQMVETERTKTEQEQQQRSGVSTSYVRNVFQ